MVGAIIGDVVGSTYEFNNIRTKDFDLLNQRATFTDDTVCTIAIMDFLLHATERNEKKATEYLQKWTNKYPYVGYGGRFRQWIRSDNPKPYNSFGNGSAMRISPIAWVANNENELAKLVEIVTKITHNHPEGMKGALVVATCIFMARNGATKEEIQLYAEKNYPIIKELKYESLKRTYVFNETCQGSVPQAIYCFLISNDFEDCLRTTISIGGDCDTTSAMSCAIAEAYYKNVPVFLISNALNKLSEEMKEVLYGFNEKYR